VKFAELIKPWSLAYIARDYPRALAALHEAMKECHDSTNIELLLKAESVTRDMMRGTLQADCAFCMRRLQQEYIAMVGVDFMCRECAINARDTFATSTKNGWTLVDCVTPASAALVLTCTFCRSPLDVARRLAGTHNHFVCATCTKTAIGNAQATSTSRAG
jgi:hypothetical protein